MKRIKDLDPAPYNPRTISDDAFDGLGYSLEAFGDISGIVFNRRTRHLVAGHQRVRALYEKHGNLAIKGGEIRTPGGEVFRLRVVDWDEAKEKAANVAANSQLLAGEFTSDLSMVIGDVNLELGDLAVQLRFDDLQLDIEHAIRMQAYARPGADSVPLQDRFLAPPFSVLDARQGYWQERKRYWIGMGIRSELGREAEAMNMQPALQRGTSGTSIFDPVICELAYRWFCPPGGHVLDPFAGGSVRGVVAGLLGYQYTGIDLRKEQVEANREQWREISARVVQ